MRIISRQPEQGIALLLSILCLLLLTAIAAGMMYLSATETAINSNFKSEESAYFAARAGVEEARDRILPANANTINPSLPTALPSGAGGVLYVLNGVSAANITNNTSPYFDDELCHDFKAIGSWSENVTANQPCATLPSGSAWYTCVPAPCASSNSAYATAAFPLEYKWVRVTLKSNNSTAYPVNGNSGDAFPVCWNGTQEKETTGGPLSVTTQCANLKPVATPVYLVTALAVMPNRGKRVVQQEIAENPTGTLPGGLFATGSGCSALNVQGNAQTGSYNSSSGTFNSSTGTYSNQVSSGGDVGSNGNIYLGGSSAAVNGQISTPLAATVGSCPGNGITKSGGATYTSATGNAPVYTAPVPPAPNPLPPTTSVTEQDVTLPVGAYGNVTVKGTVTLTGGTDVNHPAVYTINSLTFNSNATLNITGPVVINLAGQNLSPAGSAVLDMSGGSFANTSGLASDFVVNYGGSNPMTIIGGNDAFAVFNAPNSALTFKGNSNFYGQAIGSTIDLQGNGTFYWDKALVTPPPTILPLYEISLRELSY
jgi:Tfp pilus assembly protein PilX